ncbi:hypothetical protein L1049_009469 [Liquidambar formosana]|uniref:HMA domain-containing protein n=1 Tax=Liquidambar formosana TaxID=63359 RepID=A0AAP0XA01_LIQFO
MGEKDAGKNEGEKKADAGKKDDGAVVLNLEMHCEGCAKKVKRFVKNNIDGVKDAKADRPNNKLMVWGKVDVVKLREKLQEKTKKKVELISPQPKKDAKDSGGDKKPDEKSEKKPDEKKADDKKPKEVHHSNAMHTVLSVANMRRCGPNG